MTADLHPDTGLPRPGTCCGVCPPIAGGGWDCTCPGLPGCPVPAAEWDDLARLAQAATPGPWDWRGWTIPVSKPENAEFIAAANPATILRLIEQVREWHRVAASSEAARNEARIERDRLAARLAAVEALAKGWAVMAAQALDADTRDWLTAASRSVLAALAAPTDTTKEN